MKSLRFPAYLFFAPPLVVVAFTPYGLKNPLDNWTYYLESAQSVAWPSCEYRFLSYPDDCSSFDQFKAVGTNQEFSIEDEPAGTLLKTRCGQYVSYSTDCSDGELSSSGSRENAHWEVVKRGDFEWSVKAVGRHSCPDHFLGFGAQCNSSVRFTATTETWRMHAAKGLDTHTHYEHMPDGFGCPDPFVWRAKDEKVNLICTGGRLGHFQADSISPDVVFNEVGSLLSNGTKPMWAQDSNRWAPENIEVDNGVNVAVFGDFPPGKDQQRIGWVLSSTGAKNESYTQYSKEHLDLGGAPGGEIDAHVFTDDDGERYLVWKTDDNSVGSNTTRLWAQPCTVDSNGISLKGEKHVLMNSSGIWWSNSFIPDGSLIEGPEIVKKDGYYYLFFASGMFCQDSYSEGAARSKNIFGPYEKMGVQLLSTAMVGYTTKGKKLVGPGHASYMQDKQGQWFIIWHASTDYGSDPGGCHRRAFVDKLMWTEDGWPYVDFTDRTTSDTVLYV